MAIRDKFRRSRKSVSSTATSQSDQNSDSSFEAPKSSLRLAKTIAWRPKRESKSKDKPDPREKPFTETNLKHQEIFSTFTMTFGNRKGSLSSDYNISPGTSRRGSFDSGATTDVDAYMRVRSLGPGMVNAEPAPEHGPRQ